MVGFRDNGQRKYRSFYGQTQKEVRAKLRKYQEELAEGLDTDKLWGFSEWADFWYEQHKDNIAPTTQENYKYTLRILKEHFSDRALRGIKPLDIESFLKSCSGRAAPIPACPNAGGCCSRSSTRPRPTT